MPKKPSKVGVTKVLIGVHGTGALGTLQPVVTPTGTVTELLTGIEGIGAIGTLTVASEETPPPPVVTSDLIQFGEREAHWYKANTQLYADWENPGGDWLDSLGVHQGSTPFASFTIPDATPVWAEFSVASLASALLSENTGIYIKSTGGTPPAFGTKEGSPPSELSIVTSEGTFNPTLTEDTYLDISSGELGSAVSARLPMILKFDLSAVTGTVISATLRIWVGVIFSNPLTLQTYYLRMPSLITDPANQIGGVVAGIRGPLTFDNDLAATAGVLQYSDCQNSTQINGAWDIVVPLGDVVWNPVYLTWSEFGIPALRLESRLDNSRLMAWHRLTQPVSPPGSGRAYQRAFTPGSHLGYDELYFRYMLKIDEDVKDGMTELGVKLPGLSGTYEWGGTTNFASTAPADCFSLRTEHGPISTVNPDVYRLIMYAYLKELGGLTATEGTFLISNTCLRAGQIYSIEQHIKLNTFIAGVPQANGVLELWCDGVLVYQRTNVVFSGQADIQLQDAPFANIFHGGSGFTSQPIHYEVSGFCTATTYIGPAKSIHPTWRQGLPTGSMHELSGTDRSAVDPGGFGSTRYDDWGGYAWSQTTAKAYGLALGGHDRYENGVDYIDFNQDSPTVTNLKASVSFGTAIADSPYYADTTPSSAHVYNAPEVIEVRNAACRIGAQAIYGDLGFGTNDFQAFNLTTNQWLTSGTLAAVPSNTASGSGAKVWCTAKDPRSSDVYVASDQGRIRKWTCATNTWEEGRVAPLMQYKASLIDTTRNFLVAEAGNDLLTVFNINDLAAGYSQPTVLGAGSPQQDYCHMVYDPDNDLYLKFWFNGAPSTIVRLYTIDPVSKISTIVWSSSEAKYQCFNGLAKKAGYFEDLHCVIFAPNAGNVFCWPTR